MDAERQQNQSRERLSAPENAPREGLSRLSGMAGGLCVRAPQKATQPGFVRADIIKSGLDNYCNKSITFMGTTTFRSVVPTVYQDLWMRLSSIADTLSGKEMLFFVINRNKKRRYTSLSDIPSAISHGLQRAKRLCFLCQACNIVQRYMIVEGQAYCQTEGDFALALFIIGVGGFVHAEDCHQLILRQIVILAQIAKTLVFRYKSPPLTISCIDKIPHTL